MSSVHRYHIGSPSAVKRQAAAAIAALVRAALHNAASREREANIPGIVSRAIEGGHR